MSLPARRSLYRLCASSSSPRPQHKRSHTRQTAACLFKLIRCLKTDKKNFPKVPPASVPTFGKLVIVRIPALRELQQLFIGRVIHRTPEQWKEDVKSLLKFNVVSNDDTIKWKRKENES